jgi:hypothetical protein
MSCFHLKIKDVLFALCLVGVYFLPACQQNRSDLEIFGRWRSSGHYYDFNEDGTWAVGYFFNDNYIAPFDWGAFSLEGNKITFSTDELASSCPGLTGTYEFEFPNESDLIFILVEDECENRSEDFLGSDIQRVSP